MESLLNFVHAGCQELAGLLSGVNVVYSDSAGLTRGNFRIGSTVTQTCDAGNGFVSSGSDSVVMRICTSSGWSEDDLTCQR